MLAKFKKSQTGFTIIEVLIVLAIGGLIMLIVFLAVPALQRQQRNTGRKSDAARIAAAASNFVTNNNGTMPAAGSTANANTIIADAGPLSQYPVSSGWAGNNALAAQRLNIVAGAAANAAITVDGMQLVVGAICNAAGGGATSSGASPRSMALQYPTENNGGAFAGLCVDV